MAAVVRIRSSSIYGTHASPESAEGIVFLFAHEDPGAWRGTSGRAKVKRWLEGANLRLDLQLSRIDSEAGALPAAETGGGSIFLSARGASLDIGTALQIFNPQYIRFARELRYWLAEDAELVTLLPQERLSWGLDRNSDH